jgi:predicted acylesterase/phospholipase RssA
MCLLSGNKFRRAAALCLIIGFTASGCVTYPVNKIRPTAEASECVRPVPDREVLVGVTVSGGGSRAALFGAGGYEALSQLRVGPEHRSLLEQVSYVSSVSGGSLASAYYILKKPSREVPMLTPDGQLTEAYKAFFEEFKTMMARDYERPLFWHNLLRLRWFNPAWTARSLKEVLQDSYIGGASFQDLAQRETRGDNPYFLVNTTLYNNGRRLVWSTLDPDALRYDFIRDLQKKPGWDKLGPEAEGLLRKGWGDLQSFAPEDLKLDHCQLKVAAAVAGSMSFPPIIGPFTVGTEGEDQYWHIGDGGMSDNTGAESLLMVFLKQLQEGRAKRAVILAFDSSFPFEIGGKSLDHRKEGFSFFDSDYTRIPSIMEERSLAYRALFFRLAQQQEVLPDERKLFIIRLRHVDAVWKEDLSDVPESCRKEGKSWKSSKEVSEHVAGVVTRLFLKSTCDRDLVVQAAQKVVAQNEPKIRKAMGE